VTLFKKKEWGAPNTHGQNKTTIESRFKPSASGSARSGYGRELLPDPVSYYEGQGLMFMGSHRAPWRTTECRFHGGSDSMRIMVTTGAFVCMACGARGGDVLAYHMAAHSLGFVEAAKQLDAWAGDVRGERQYRPTPLSARDALSILAPEATLIALEGTRIGNGIELVAADLERVRTAAARINHLRGMFT
jgi:ribosomal protein L40E